MRKIRGKQSARRRSVNARRRHRGQAGVRVRSKQAIDRLLLYFLRLEQSWPLVTKTNPPGAIAVEQRLCSRTLFADSNTQNGSLSASHLISMSSTSKGPISICAMGPLASAVCKVQALRFCPTMRRSERQPVLLDFWI